MENKNTNAEPGMMDLYSGKRIDIMNMKPEDIIISDIAVGLSRQIRFAGQTKNCAYTVAQHCVVMAVCMMESNPEMALEVLMHDAHEYLTGDIPKPIKLLLGDTIIKIENAIQDPINKKFSLNYSSPTDGIVNTLDTTFGNLEYDYFFKGDDDFAKYLSKAVRYLGFQNQVHLVWPADFAERAFINMFYNLERVW